MADDAHDTGPSHPPLLTTTIGADLAATAARVPDRDALVDVPSGRRWTYAELVVAVRRLAAGLLRLGVAPGERVGIWAPNVPEWTLVQLAAAEVGAVLVTINPAYGAHELEFVLRQAGVRTVVAAPGFRDADYAALLAEVAPRCPALRERVVVGSTGWTTLAEGESDDAAVAEVAAGLRPDDPINVQYTSGTTGFPKGATLSHRNILNNGYLVGELVGYTEADRVCVPVPFYHCFGMVMGTLACTSHGAALVIPGPGFDPGATLAAVAAERCTSLYGVPTMFIAELDLPGIDDHDLSSLRTGIMAGSPCPEAVMRQVIERMGMGGVSICYGMTETSPVSLQTRSDDPLERRVTTVGRAGPHLEVKVVSPDGATLARGRAGELCTRGYSVMLGYWDQPGRTADVLRDGWMRTGDLAVMDDDGYVRITGRLKDVIIRGGENISPLEVEEFLRGHPDVADVQVIGVPDERYGEEVMAWVRLREGARALTAQAVAEFCAGRLARFKVPRHVKVVREFPMTVTGKVRKVEMRAVSAAELGPG